MLKNIGKNRIVLMAIKDVMGSTERIEKIHIDDIINDLENGFRAISQYKHTR